MKGDSEMMMGMLCSNQSPQSVDSSGMDSGVDSLSEQIGDMPHVAISLCGGLTDNREITRGRIRNEQGSNDRRMKIRLQCSPSLRNQHFYIQKDLFRNICMSMCVCFCLCVFCIFHATEQFQERAISFQQFSENPSIIDDPNLVVKIGNKYVLLYYIQNQSVVHI